LGFRIKTTDDSVYSEFLLGCYYFGDCGVWGYIGQYFLERVIAVRKFEVDRKQLEVPQALATASQVAEPS